MRKKYKNSYLSYFLMYLFYFMSWALFATLISVYVLDKGYSASDVSLVVSASLVSSLLFQVFVGRWSDRSGRKKVTLVLTMIACLGGVLFLFAESLLLIAAGYAVVLTCLNCSCPLVEKTATASPFGYGKIRWWGTVGYAVGSQLSGLIYDHVAPWAVYAAFLVTMCLAVAGVWGTMPREDVVPGEEPKKEERNNNIYRELLGNSKFLLYIAISVIFTIFTTICSTYLPAMFQADGLSVSAASTIISIAVVFELPLILFAGKFMDRTTSRMIMLIGYVMVILQFAAYGFSDSMPLKVAITLLAKHPSVMLYTMVNLKVVHSLVGPRYQMTALAVAASVKSLAAVLGQTIAGRVLDQVSYATLYAGAAGIMAVFLVLFLFFRIENKDEKEQLFSS